MRRHIRRIIPSLLFAGALAAPLPAAAWSASGHRQIGSLAYSLLTPHAKREVDRLTGGFSLAQMSVWADCAKDVKHNDTRGYYYTAGPKAAKECHEWEKDATQSDMLVRFERENWNVCAVDRRRGCAPQFHFINLPVNGPGYVQPVGSTFSVGQHPYDIAHVLRAAIIELETPGDADNAPFNFTDADALKLVAHLVGDISQPLHVGVVYLELDGSIVPFSKLSPAVEKRFGTAGGNILGRGSSNLHSLWDGPPNVSQAEPPLGLPGDPRDWWVTYASDTFKQSQIAFRGLTFTKHNGDVWPTVVPAGTNYNAVVASSQRRQIGRGARALAEALNWIWPGN